MRPHSPGHALRIFRRRIAGWHYRYAICHSQYGTFVLCPLLGSQYSLRSRPRLPPSIFSFLIAASAMATHPSPRSNRFHWCMDMEQVAASWTQLRLITRFPVAPYHLSTANRHQSAICEFDRCGYHCRNWPINSGLYPFAYNGLTYLMVIADSHGKPAIRMGDPFFFARGD